jgi:hypothetical protein
LNDIENVFVVSVLEHESTVNYTSSFKMLQYINYILVECVNENDARYEDEIKKYGETKLKLSTHVDFKYPPVFPIIFYDGVDSWTSEKNFYDKTDMNSIFEKYIPKFEYELVNLNDYGQNDLIEFNNALSLLLIVDKIRKSEDIKKLKELPEQFIEEMLLPPSDTAREQPKRNVYETPKKMSQSGGHITHQQGKPDVSTHPVGRDKGVHALERLTCGQYC